MHDNGFIHLPNMSSSGQAEMLLRVSVILLSWVCRTGPGCTGHAGRRGGMRHCGRVLLHQPQQHVECCILSAHTKSCSTHCPLERQSDSSGIVVSQWQVAYLFFCAFPEGWHLHHQKTSEKTLLQQCFLLRGWAITQIKLSQCLCYLA